jgi:hypothetical protein
MHQDRRQLRDPVLLSDPLVLFISELDQIQHIFGTWRDVKVRPGVVLNMFDLVWRSIRMGHVGKKKRPALEKF